MASSRGSHSRQPLDWLLSCESRLRPRRSSRRPSRRRRTSSRPSSRRLGRGCTLSERYAPPVPRQATPSPSSHIDLGVLVHKLRRLAHL
eukprot:2935397-Pleurochrysis_carterae.AAC.1